MWPFQRRLRGGPLVEWASDGVDQCLLRVCRFDDRVDAEREELLALSRIPRETDDAQAQGARVRAVRRGQTAQVG